MSIKQECIEYIEDITLLQNDLTLRRKVESSSFINLCAFKLELQAYIDSDSFPDQIVPPDYDLSSLIEMTTHFSRLHKEEYEGVVRLANNVRQHLTEI